MDVYLDEQNVYRPDVMFISNEQKSILGDDGYIHGAPHLIIEVLSPETTRYDRTEKKEVYEKFGVKEHWLIEPVTLQCEGFISKNNSFRLLAKTEQQFTIQLLNLVIGLIS